jgi:hypothetical protein
VLTGNNVTPVLGGDPTPDPRAAYRNPAKRIDQALQAKEITPIDGVKPLQGGLDKIKEEMTRMRKPMASLPRKKKTNSTAC